MYLKGSSGERIPYRIRHPTLGFHDLRRIDEGSRATSKGQPAQRHSLTRFRTLHVDVSARHQKSSALLRGSLTRLVALVSKASRSSAGSSINAWKTRSEIPTVNNASMKSRSETPSALPPSM